MVTALLGYISLDAFNMDLLESQVAICPRTTGGIFKGAKAS